MSVAVPIHVIVPVPGGVYVPEHPMLPLHTVVVVAPCVHFKSPVLGFVSVTDIDKLNNCPTPAEDGIIIETDGFVESFKWLLDNIINILPEFNLELKSVPCAPIIKSFVVSLSIFPIIIALPKLSEFPSLS